MRQYYSPQFMGALAQMMPMGVTATGRPGELDIPGYGVRKFTDIREDPIYDYVALTTTIAKGDELVFFRNTADKKRWQTNLSEQSKLAAGEEAVIYRINVVPAPDTTPEDVLKIFKYGYGEFTFDDDNRVRSGPLLTFDQAHGLYGAIATTKNDERYGVVTNGVPSEGANPMLRLPLYIYENRTFRFSITFFTAPALSVDTFAWVILDCIRARPGIR